jgi:hypothetical protein
MRNLLAVSAAALLTFAAVGWYLGWYRVQTEPAGSGHRQVTIDINGPKIGEDLGKGKAKLHDLLESKGPVKAPLQPAQGRQQAAPPSPPPPQAVPGGPNWTRPAEEDGVSLPDLVNAPAPSLPPPPPGQ